MGPSPSKDPKPAPAKTQQPPPSTPPAVASPSTPSTSGTPVFAKRRPVQNQKANSSDLAILELKVQRERLKKTTEKYSNLSDKLKASAIECMKKTERQQEEEEVVGVEGLDKEAAAKRNKANALSLIKRSRQYEKQLENYSNTLLNLETQITAIEDGQMNLQVMKSLEGGKNVLEEINSQLSRADEVMDSVREAVAESREIGEILASSVSLASAEDLVDEDELEKELQKMMNPNQQKATTSKAPTTVANQVTVPKHDIQQKGNATAAAAAAAGGDDDLKVPSHQVGGKESEGEEKEGQRKVLA